MKKLLTLVLALCLMACVFTGFASAEEEHPTITWMMAGDNNPSEDNIVLQEIEKRTGVHLEVIYISSGDYGTKLNAMIASRTLPDIFSISGQDALELRDAGMLYNFEEELQEYGQDILAELGDDLYKMVINADGGIYGVRSNTPGKIDNMVIRKDWLANVGMEVPTNLDELYDVLYAFTYNDPDGNGQNDTYGLSCSLDNTQNWQHFFSYYGIAYKQNYMLEDGTVTTYMKAPDYLKVIEYLRKLYQNGILDPDFATLSNMQTFEKLWNGIVGFYAWEAVGPTNNWYPARYTFEVPENPEDIFAGIHFEGVPGGTKMYVSYTNNAAVISADCKDPAAAVKLINYMQFTDEGAELINFGVEGEMFEWVDKANGKYQRLGIYTDDATHRAAGGFVYGAGWKVENAELSTLNAFTRQLQAEEREIACDYPYIIQILETRTEYGAELDKIAAECFANLIVTDGDVEAEYAEYVERWNEEGGLEFEEEATRAWHEEND